MISIKTQAVTVPELETPDDPESIYLARLEDVGETDRRSRAASTDSAMVVMVMILPAPCAAARR